MLTVVSDQEILLPLSEVSNLIALSKPSKFRKSVIARTWLVYASFPAYTSFLCLPSLDHTTL